MDGKLREDVWKMDVCVCVQVRKCRYLYVVVVVAAACFAVLARAVSLSLAMLPRPVVRQQRKSGYAFWGSMPLGNWPVSEGYKRGSFSRILAPSAAGHAGDAGSSLYKTL